MSKPNYEKPTSQLDLEARQKDDYQPSSVLTKGTDPELSNNGYVGVDPIYQTFASETEKPFLAEKGPEKKIEDNYVSDDVDLDQAATPEGESDADKYKDEDEKSSTPTPASTPTPPATQS